MRQIALLEAEPLAAVSLITQRPGWLSDSKLEAGDDRGEIQAYLFRKLMRGELLIALECYKKRGFPGGASGKEPVYKCRRHKRGELDPLQEDMATHSYSHSCLENLMDRGAWWVMVHSIVKSRTQMKQHSTHACYSKRRRRPEEIRNCSAKA